MRHQMAHTYVYFGDPRTLPGNTTNPKIPILLISGGSIVDGLGNRPLSGDLRVCDQLIVAVASTSDLPDCPTTITRIDASGMTVMPGLIDPHCHISFDGPNSNDELAAIFAAANVHKLLHAGVAGFFDAECWFEIRSICVLRLRWESSAGRAWIPAAPQGV